MSEFPIIPPRRLLVTVASILLACCVHGKEYRVTVAPANVDRAAQVLRFKLPAEAARATGLKGASGPVLPLQVTGTDAVFVVPEQKAGETLTFSLQSDAKPANAVEARQGKATAPTHQKVSFPSA